MSEFPGWTLRKPGAEGHGGRWALGLEPMGFRMTRVLLPGITNATRRVRYFSFLSWVFWTFQEHHRQRGISRATEAEQTQWRKRLENAWRAASVETGELDGLIGRRGARALPPGEALLHLEERDPITAWRADTYQSSWLSLNLGHVEQKVAILHPYPGRELALAFDESVRAADGGSGAREQLLSDTREVPASVIRRLAPALSLGSVPVGAPEHARLVDALFRTSGEPEPANVQRRNEVRMRSLTMLLDFLRKAQGSLETEHDIHAVLALGRFPDGRLYVPAPALEDVYLCWRQYQEREQQKLALYGLWGEVLKAIGQDPWGRASAEVIVGTILNWVRTSEIAREWLGADPLALSITEALRRLPGEAAEREALAHTLSLQLLDHAHPDHAGAAALLLLVVCARWKGAQKGLSTSALRMHGGTETDLPLPSMVEQVERRGGESLGGLVAWVLERWVLAQSLAVALQKWQRNQDRFFIARDEEGYRIVKHHPPSNFLVFDRPRIWSSLQLLQDLHLVRMDGGLAVTGAGEELSQRTLEQLARRETNTGLVP